jgi:hypothetical protein
MLFSEFVGTQNHSTNQGDLQAGRLFFGMLQPFCPVCYNEPELVHSHIETGPPGLVNGNCHKTKGML